MVRLKYIVYDLKDDFNLELFKRKAKKEGFSELKKFIDSFELE